MGAADTVGERVGCGVRVGAADTDGSNDGTKDGRLVGLLDGRNVGVFVGLWVGDVVTATVGDKLVGTVIGDVVGGTVIGMGCDVGSPDGIDVVTNTGVADVADDDGELVTIVGDNVCRSVARHSG